MFDTFAPEWRMLALGTLITALLVVGVLATLSGGANGNLLDRAKARLGLRSVPSALLVVAGVFWTVLFLWLFLGLLGLAFHAITLVFDSADLTDIRTDLFAIAALTATLGAVVALPFTLIRLTLTRDQNRHAEDVLFNAKITEATRDLYAQRQVTKPLVRGGSYQHHQDFWEDDIIRRNAAIDQLERLVEERAENAVGVARMLSVYVRELSKEHHPVDPPEGASPDELKTWAGELQLQRSDMEKAVQTLGRLRSWAAKAGSELIIDLRGANLQAMSLERADLDKAQLEGARLQGANLFRAQLQGANLFRAQLQGADLYEAQLQGADLGGAQLQGADLGEAQLQGANLGGAQMDDATNLSAAPLRGAALRFVDYTQVNISHDQIDSVFGDASVILPEHIEPPERFLREYDSWTEFEAAWRAWQKEIGFDPDDPATWDE